jgi:phage anti-repressor protein
MKNPIQKILLGQRSGLLTLALTFSTSCAFSQAIGADHKNESVIYNPTFVVTQMHINKDKLLVWEAKDETTDNSYLVQQYKWGNWVEVGKLQSNGFFGESQYSIEVEPHSGLNRYRVAMQNDDSTFRSSPTVAFLEELQPVDCIIRRRQKQIEFSEETDWILVDLRGNTVKDGRGVSVDIEGLAWRKWYFICFDNSYKKFRP